MRKLIWYNPDLDIYQKGTLLEYDRLLLTSINNYRFNILYEFSSTSHHLADKVLESLNSVRSLKLEAITY